ncbi:Uncharacterised protein [Mycobacterium tuberculosis]|nr:Uncharacterised protein [Mycobacterium tuberculosis]
MKLIFLSRRPIAIFIYLFLIMESVFRQKIKRKFLTVFIEKYRSNWGDILDLSSTFSFDNRPLNF